MRRALSLAGWALPAAAPVVPPVARAFDIPLRIPHGVALTFDDGPHPEGTPAVLELLGERPATFFLVGEQVERFPSVAADIAARGHEIALHGYRHRLLLRRSPRAFADDLERALRVIEDATSRTPTVYRPPYGVFSLPALDHVRERGLRPLLWSKWGKDWQRRATGASIAARATSGFGSGDVVLLHDADHYSVDGSWRNTVAALPAIFQAVTACGAELCSVSQAT